jgi:hypothetical protein
VAADAFVSGLIGIIALYMAPFLAISVVLGTLQLSETLPSSSLEWLAVWVGAAAESVAWFTQGGLANLPSTLALRHPSFGIPIGLMFYSTFLTSVWLWLYLASTSIVGWMPTIRYVWRRLGKTYDLKMQPFASLGEIAAMIFAAIWSCVLPIVVLRAIF